MKALNTKTEVFRFQSLGSEELLRSMSCWAQFWKQDGGRSWDHTTGIPRTKDRLREEWSHEGLVSRMRQRKGCEKSPERTNWEDGDIRNQYPGEGRIQNDVEMSCVWVTRKENGVVQEFPGSPVVRVQHFHFRGPESIPDQGTKIPQPMQYNQKKRKWQCLYQNKKYSDLLH